MCRLIFTLLIVIPIVEITLLTYVASQIGFLDCLLLAFCTAAFGLIVFKRQGAALPLRLQRGEIEPTEAALETAGLTLGAVLLMIPGFFTDTFGLALLIAPVRRVVARRLSQRIAGKTVNRPVTSPPAYDDIIVIKKKPKT